MPLAIVIAAIVVATGLVGAAVIITHNRRPAAAPPNSSAIAGEVVPADQARINANCNTSSAPLTILDSQAAEEPVLALPQPAGWTFDTRMNNALIRSSLTSTEGQGDTVKAVAVVTLENVTDRVHSVLEAMDAEIDGLVTVMRANVESQAPGAVCGYAGSTVDYSITNRTGTGLIVAAKDSQDRIWTAAVTIQSFEPESPDYLEAKRVILDGFQFSLRSDLLRPTT
ncbi:hypothetical protein [Mycolicibacter minnesotensis]